MKNRCFLLTWAWLLLAGPLAHPALAQAPAFDLALGGGTIAWDHPRTDAGGNLYVRGTLTGITTLGGTVLDPAQGKTVVAKRSVAGAWLWAAQANTGLAQYAAAGLAVDASGNAFLVGNFTANATFGPHALAYGGRGVQGFVAKLDAAGNWLWARSTGDLGGGGALWAAATDGSGAAYVTGYFFGTTTVGGTTISSAGGADVVVAKIDGAGTWQWAARAGSSGNDLSIEIAADASGNCYPTGGLGPAANFDGTLLTSAGGGFVAKLNSAGQWQWATPAVGSSFGRVVAVDGVGSVYVGGEIGNSQTAGFSASFGSTTLSSTAGVSGFVAKLNPTGNWLWAKAVGGNSADRCQGLALDGTAVYVAGHYRSNPLTLGTVSLPLQGVDDVFVARLDGSGTFAWATSLATTAGSFGDPVLLAVDSQHRVYVGGPFYGRLTVGSTTLTGTQGSALGGGFVARLAAVPTATRTELMAPAFALWPNPARTAVQLSGATGTVAVLLDALGREVLRQPFALGAATLDVHGLPAGLYAGRCGGATRRLVIE